MKNISIIGSTGSIGIQTLDIVRNLREYNVLGLAANTNISVLEKQIREFKPKLAAVFDINKAKMLKNNVKDTSTKVLAGMEGLVEVSANSSNNLSLISVSGTIGLIPTVETIKNKINIALATKEVLVSAGSIVTDYAKQNKVRILPVDSEHSAIMQCLLGNSKTEVNKLILTASGGPFRGKDTDQLRNVSTEEALRHPNWKMGKKITIDSATLMNKGLEVIEARWLFDIEPAKIEVLVHPQSIIHSMVEYVDGSVIAQLAATDMKGPIQYALTYPDRINANIERINLAGKNLTFEQPDFETFKALSLAYKALDIGGTMPAVLNASNEVAVELFLNGKIAFLDIADFAEKCMEEHKAVHNPSLAQILEADDSTRKMAYKLAELYIN